MIETIEYHEGQWDVSLVVRAARLGDATRRAIWQSEAAQAAPTDKVERYLRMMVHPDLCAPLAPESSLVIEGEAVTLPIEYATFAAFPEMPDALYTAWSQAVYKCNPAWQVGQDDAEKKVNEVTTSTEN